MRSVLTVVLLLFCLVLMGAQGNCSGTPSAVQKQAHQAAQSLNEAEARIGPAGIVNYTERRFMKTILELRDSEVVTYSYYMDMHGGLHFLCNSIGYGLPYSTQYTNPQQRSSNAQGAISLPQVDPNGLYSPDNVAATWIICSNPGDPEPYVVYWEPDLIVSPFRLAAKTNLKE